MRSIHADINSIKGTLSSHLRRCIGAGRAAEVMRHVAYEQLCTIQKECPFDYIRFHGLFHDEMAIVSRDGDEKLRFNFQYVDLLFDSLLDINIRPIVELGLMPEALAEKNEHVFWWKMNKSSAKNMKEWYALNEALVRHVADRYGVEEIKKWYFEIWNEPNLASFFSEHNNINAYFELYDNAALAVKSVCSDYRVGGPATAGLKWINELITHCKENNIPLDFVSSHQYCVKGAFDADGKKQLQMLHHEHLNDSVCKAGDICLEAGVPFILSEWSASYSSRDPVHDSYFSAPFILQALKRCEGHAQMMSYWVYTDIFEEVAPPYQLFHGGFGLFTVRSIKKPAYHSFRFLAELGETELICEDTDSYACRSENEVQLLIWNSVYPDQKEMTNATYFTQDLPAKPLEDASVTISGLKAQKCYSITVETVGYRMGDCYTAYLDMGSPKEPTREQTVDLCRYAQPKKTEMQIYADANGNITLQLPQTENQVDLIKVSLI